MKLLKYIAILAVLSVSGLSYAQTAPAAPAVQVATSTENGAVKLAIKMDVSNPLTSSEDALKKAVAEAIKTSGVDFNTSRALSAAMTAVKAALKDPNYPAKGTVIVNATLKNTVENTLPAIDTEINAEIGGQKINSLTRSVFNADGTVATKGNVSTDGVAAALPVALSTDNAGNISGSTGNATVAEKTPETVLAESVTTSPEDKPETKAQTKQEIVPDNTIRTTTVQ